jgi:hypothetical protein
MLLQLTCQTKLCTSLCLKIGRVSSTKARHADGEGDDDVVVMWGGLAAFGDNGERRRYHGTVDGVGGEARTRKINDPSRAVAEIDGVEVGRGGGLS